MVRKKGYEALGVGLLVAFALGPVASSSPAPAGEEVTITSDQMELIDHGQKTIFEGNVVLQKISYELKADRMTRSRESGLIEAEGRIQAMWKSPEGGQVDVKGEHGRYGLATEVAELWVDPSRKVIVDWTDANGSAHFLSERAEFHAGARKVRLLNRVTGHIIPASR